MTHKDIFEESKELGKNLTTLISGEEKTSSEKLQQLKENQIMIMVIRLKSLLEKRIAQF